MPKREDKGARPAIGFERTVSVTASGSVSAQPDLASIAARVLSEAEGAGEALARNSAAMRAVLEGLGNLGVSSRDIQTASFQLDPRYPAKPPAGGPPQIAGYRAVNQLTIVVRDLDRLGDIIDQLVRLGINQLDSLAFEVNEADKLRDEARRRAMANALQRARLLAAAADAELGQVLSISEGAGGPSAGPARVAMMESVPIERGAQTLDVQVSVTWALK